MEGFQGCCPLLPAFPRLAKKMPRGWETSVLLAPRNQVLAQLGGIRQRALPCPYPPPRLQIGSPDPRKPGNDCSATPTNRQMEE